MRLRFASIYHFDPEHKLFRQRFLGEPGAACQQDLHCEVSWNVRVLVEAIDVFWEKLRDTEFSDHIQFSATRPRVRT